LQDVNLPDGSGLDALLEYKKRKPQAIVIMITGNVQSHPLHLNANAL
jgi:DNA-binding NtrC family response regulator